MNERRDADYFAPSAAPPGPLAFVLVMYFFADLVSAAIIRAPPGSEAAATIIAGVFGSQAILLSQWLGLGTARYWVRLTLVAGWCVLVPGFIIPFGGWEPEFFGGILLGLLLSAAPYGVLKVMGFSVVLQAATTQTAHISPIAGNTSVGAEIPRDGRASGDTRVQFSIVQIFGWMLTVGILATVARLSGIPIEAALPLLILVSIFTAISFSTMWAVLGGPKVRARLLVPLGVVVLVTMIASAFMGFGRRGQETAYIFIALFATTSFVAAVLAMFRSAGYRARREFASGHRRAPNRDEPAIVPSSPWETVNDDDS